MSALKNSLWPILLITIASAILMFAIAPLANSEWADGIRQSASAEEGSSEDREPELGGVLSIIGPLLKITVLMGVPGLITLGVLRITRRRGKRSVARASPN